MDACTLFLSRLQGATAKWIRCWSRAHEGHSLLPLLLPRNSSARQRTCHNDIVGGLFQSSAVCTVAVTPYRHTAGSQPGDQCVRTSTAAAGARRSLEAGRWRSPPVPLAAVNGRPCARTLSTAVPPNFPAALPLHCGVRPPGPGAALPMSGPMTNSHARPKTSWRLVVQLLPEHHKNWPVRR